MIFLRFCVYFCLFLLVSGLTRADNIDCLFSMNICEGDIHRKYEIEMFPNKVIEKKCYYGPNITTYRFEDGSLKEVKDFSGKHTLDYDVDGKLCQIEYSNGMKCHIEYEASGKVTSVEYIGPKSKSACLFSYQYDEIKRCISW